jgi:putative ABC transport system permease protein
MRYLAQDIRYAARMLLKKPSFTLIAIVTLALGIGANTAVFSVIKSVLLGPLPYPNADHLVQFHLYFPSISYEQPWIAPRDAADWAEQSDSFERVGVYRSAMLNFSNGGLPEAVYGLRVSADLLPALGVPPALGRYFSADEDQPGNNHVIILSDDLWRSHFNRDPSIIGRRIFISRETYEVVGVMPPGFNFPLRMPLTAKLPSRQMGYWYPLGLDLGKSSREETGFGAIARLKSGVTIGQARAEMNQVASRLAADYPQTNNGREVRLVSLKDQTVGDVRPTLYVLLGAVALVVLIACANVASLLLVGAESRQQEIFIRQSLGATRWRLARQMLTESLLLAMIGGGCGVLLARWVLPLLLSVAPQAIPRLTGAGVDAGVLGFTLAVCVLSGLLFGLAPAFRTPQGDLSAGLKRNSLASSPRRGRAGNALIAAEVALALVLTLGASLLLNSFVRLISVDPGFDADKVVACVVLVPNSQYPRVEAKLEFFRRVIERVKEIPGVESAAASDTLPFSGQNGSDQVRIEGRPPVARIDASLQAEASSVTSEFIQTMGIHLIRGRLFNDHDTADAPPVAVMSEAAATQFWPGEDPLGKRMSFGVSDDHRVWRQVIGIVNTTHNAGIDQPPRPHVYLPVEQTRYPANFLVVRSELPSAKLAVAVREAVAAVDKNQPVFLTASLGDWIADSYATRRFTLVLFGIFGGLALMLAVVGIYGVISHTIGQRTREIGIRIALGAQSQDIVRLIVRDGMAPAIGGLTVGLIGAAALTRLLGSLLFEVSPLDPATFAVAAIALTIVAVLACWLPARRASTIDPLLAIRHE